MKKYEFWPEVGQLDYMVHIFCKSSMLINGIPVAFFRAQGVWDMGPPSLPI